MKISTEVKNQEGVVVISVDEATIDHSNSASFKEKLFLEIADGNSKIIINLQNVNEMDSSGLGALLFGKRQANHAGGDAILVGVQPAVHSMLRIAQLSRVFSIYDTTDEAVASFE